MPQIPDTPRAGSSSGLKRLEALCRRTFSSRCRCLWGRRLSRRGAQRFRGHPKIRRGGQWQFIQNRRSGSLANGAFTLWFFFFGPALHNSTNQNRPKTKRTARRLPYIIPKNTNNATQSQRPQPRVRTWHDLAKTKTTTHDGPRIARAATDKVAFHPLDGPTILTLNTIPLPIR